MYGMFELGSVGKMTSVMLDWGINMTNESEINFT